MEHFRHIFISEHANEHIEKIKKIGDIKPGQYWCTALSSPQTPNYLTSAIRTWYTNENRKLNIEDITQTIMTGIYLLTIMDNLPESAAELKMAIIRSKEGIKSLATTYHMDVKTVTQLKKLLSTIDEELK